MSNKKQKKIDFTNDEKKAIIARGPSTRLQKDAEEMVEAALRGEYAITQEEFKEQFTEIFKYVVEFKNDKKSLNDVMIDLLIMQQKYVEELYLKDGDDVLYYPSPYLEVNKLLKEKLPSLTITEKNMEVREEVDADVVKETCKNYVTFLESEKDLLPFVKTKEAKKMSVFDVYERAHLLNYTDTNYLNKRHDELKDLINSFEPKKIMTDRDELYSFKLLGEIIEKTTIDDLHKLMQKKIKECTNELNKNEEQEKSSSAPPPENNPFQNVNKIVDPQRRKIIYDKLREMYKNNQETVDEINAAMAYKEDNQLWDVNASLSVKQDSVIAEITYLVELGVEFTDNGTIILDDNIKLVTDEQVNDVEEALSVYYNDLFKDVQTDDEEEDLIVEAYNLYN